MPRKQVRYAVVGLGHIAQVAVLPAFGNARRNSRLAALVSGDPVKLEELGAKYHVDPRYSYERYDEMLKSGEVDAVYIATPNSLHAEYAIRAAQAGLHVLVEKPMAVTEEQCERMAEAARTAGVKLMVAYRLHFERGQPQAIGGGGGPVPGAAPPRAARVVGPFPRLGDPPPHGAMGGPRSGRIGEPRIFT